MKLSGSAGRSKWLESFVFYDSGGDIWVIRKNFVALSLLRKPNQRHGAAPEIVTQYE